MFNEIPKNQYHPTKGSREDSASKMRRINGKDSNKGNSSDIIADPNKYTARESSPKLRPTKKGNIHTNNI